MISATRAAAHRPTTHRPILKTMALALTLGLGAVGFGASAVQAQDDDTATTMVESMQDWSVHEASDPRECMAVSTFTESVNTDESGRLKSVTRGDILLIVFFRPAEGLAGQVAFTGGYPFADGSFVEAEISGTTYQLFTEGEWAWPANAAEDTKLVEAMKRGADAVLTARSSRGTVTKDTFSLLGFTAAYEEAQSRCATASN